MRKIEMNTIKGLAFSASALALLVGTPALAQDDEQPDGVVTSGQDEEDVVDVTETGADGSVSDGSIVVTGSRIKRDTYKSISPLQVLTTERENEAGLFDPSQILQRSESAAGTQIDATFQGFVLDNGPGSQTIDLRGLGAERTLVLVNGRRVAPAGVEGAPTSPSINLIPGSLVDRYDLLTDGASSVYGSDAIAGVVNAILKKDFDGLELYARGEINPQGGGDDYTISGAYGLNFDRGFIGIGAEYDYRDTVTLGDRDFFRGCDKNYEIDQNGNIRTVGVIDNALVQAQNPAISVSQSECKVGGISGRIYVPYTYMGSIYYQGDGFYNTAVPGFSESTDAFGRNRDDNGDGIRDVDFQNVNTNSPGVNDDVTFLSQQKLYNVMAYGEYTLAGAGNITPFFEATYSRAEIKAPITGFAQLFPYVPGPNQFNPCNPDQNPDGVSCIDADNILQGGEYNPNTGYTGSLPVQPIVSIRGDRNNTDVKQEQYRGVIGVRGDLPFIAPSWTFEASGVYSYSKGISIRRGIREDKLAFALGLDPTASYDDDGIADNDGDGIADDYDNNLDVWDGDPQWIGECNAAGLANPELAAPDLLQGCVPVNLFAPSVLTGAVGDFASQAERDYVFGVRRFDTRYEQMIGNFFVTGDLFEIQGGPVGAVIGAEIRKDKIDSRPSMEASNGLLWGYFRDRGAIGSKVTKELFGELDFPLIADKPLVRELSFNASGRMTNDEIYGTNWTYALKAGWRPIDPLLLKFSYGTSFRAPNLRENFLAGQSGFLSLFDPCAVPAEAYEPLNETNPGYQADKDTREASVLEACRREGRDPTTVGTNGVNAVNTNSIEIEQRGTFEIDPETSRSLTTGFAFEETFGENFDVSLGFNYYDVKVKNSIIELSTQFAINDCFLRQDGTRSRFCDLLEYGTTPSSRGLISAAFPIFLNQDQESVRGIDLNGYVAKEVSVGDQLVKLGLDVRANHLIERSSLYIDDSGDNLFYDAAGTFGFPKWTGRATFNADIDKFRFTWATRYTGPVEQDADGIDPLSDAFGYGPDGVRAGVSGDTCLGGGSRTTAGVPNGRVEGDGIYCRDVGFADAQFLHTASIRYRDDRMTLIVGVDNIFNTAPPLVDSSEVLAIANTAIGNGYDYDGREFFASIRYDF